jgi:hypothetical protein
MRVPAGLRDHGQAQGRQPSAVPMAGWARAGRVAARQYEFFVRPPAGALLAEAGVWSVDCKG